jgi:hypothetical protein
VQSQRNYKKEKARREARDMPRTPPPPEEVEESESRSRITQLWWLEHELTSVHTNLEHALVALRRLMATMNSVHTHEVAVLNEDKESVTSDHDTNPERHDSVPDEHEGAANGDGSPAVRNRRRKDFLRNRRRWSGKTRCASGPGHTRSAWNWCTRRGLMKRTRRRVREEYSSRLAPPPREDCTPGEDGWKRPANVVGKRVCHLQIAAERYGTSQGPHGRARASNCGSLAGTRRAQHRGKKNGGAESQQLYAAA